MNRDIEAAKLCVEQLQALFNHIQYSQKEVIYQSNRAELDVDDIFDHLLSKFIKMISKKRRGMKAQVLKPIIFKKYKIILYLFLFKD